MSVLPNGKNRIGQILPNGQMFSGDIAKHVFRQVHKGF